MSNTENWKRDCTSLPGHLSYQLQLLHTRGAQLGHGQTAGKTDNLLPIELTTAGHTIASRQRLMDAANSVQISSQKHLNSVSVSRVLFDRHSAY